MWPFDQLSGVVEQLVQLPFAIASLLQTLLLEFFYPLVVLWNVFISWLNFALGIFTGFFNGFLSAANLVISLQNTLLVGHFPSPWVALLGFMVLFRVCMRLYFFLRDIEILGNKV